MHIVIIGNGISGITAARFVRKLSGHQITVISAETDFFFSRTALMYVYMGHMRFSDTQPYEPWFWEKNKVHLLRATVERVDSGSKTIYTSKGREIAYDKLVIATGSKSNKFGWPGQDLEGVRGLYSYQDLEAIEKASQGLARAVVVGGGLIGVEMVEMFHSRQIPVTFLVREKNYWDIVLPEEESAMVSRHIRAHGIDLRLSTELKEITDDGHGRAGGVITGQGERIDCGFVGLTAGVSPNIDFLKNSGIETRRGVLVDNFLETNIPDVYAAGDCAELRDPQPGRRAVEAIWYSGRMMGETLAYTLCGIPKTYDPGVWFNSAKFFDLEYQVYGSVLPNPPAHHLSLYWEHPEENKSIRLVYDSATRAVVGFNLMGVRYRHAVCERWIREQVPVEEVLEHLSLANFDPELFREYETAVLDQYFRQSGRRVTPKAKRGLSRVLKHFTKKQKSS